MAGRYAGLFNACNVMRLTAVARVTFVNPCFRKPIVTVKLKEPCHVR